MMLGAHVEPKYLMHIGSAVANWYLEEHPELEYSEDDRDRFAAYLGTYYRLIMGPIRLFNEVIRLRIGETKELTRARDMAWSWLLAHPLNPASKAWNRWSGYQEGALKDSENVNAVIPMITAQYILSHDDPASIDPHWAADVGHLIDWTKAMFGRGPYYGAWAIDEQERDTVRDFRRQLDRSTPTYVSTEGCHCRNTFVGGLYVDRRQLHHHAAPRQ
jgi:hypothetical protein